MESRARFLGHSVHQMLVAAPFGSIDLMAIPVGTRVNRVGTWHAIEKRAGLWPPRHVFPRKEVP